MRLISYIFVVVILFLNSCLPPSDPYPNEQPSTIVAQARQISDSIEAYIYKWVQGQAGDSIPDRLIPAGITDCKNFYLKNPDSVSSWETWAFRYSKPINKDSLLAGIPDPNVTYLFLGTALAPFGSKLIIEGEFPHCRFFSIQITPPLNGKEYYAQRQFGSAEVSIVDADIEPLPGNVNPFQPGANRNSVNRKYKLIFNLETGDPVGLNGNSHIFPYRTYSNQRTGAMIVYQGPLGHKTIVGTPLTGAGDWNLGGLWIRIYEPDIGTGPLGGVPVPKVCFELPTGEKYFIGSDFSVLRNRADATIANRVTGPGGNDKFGPAYGWQKSWGITRSILTGVALSLGYNRIDSAQRIRDIDLGWTGRGEFQPPPGQMEPHATTNNYNTYLGRSLSLAPGMVAVLTGKLPIFPSTKNGETIMGTGQMRYWSICGIDQDPFSPMPATTIHSISDDELILDNKRNYVIVYSRSPDRPFNAFTGNGVNWVDWGTQSDLGLLTRWLCVYPEWSFAYAPQENNLNWAKSDWAGSTYDSSLVGINWYNGFMQCYLPRVHVMTKEQFEALGTNLTAEIIPVWVDSNYAKAGSADSQLGTVSATSVLDSSNVNIPVNVIDGNLNSAWSSEWGNPGQSITIDLGSSKMISAIKLCWDWIFFGKEYFLEVSDDNTSWQIVGNAANENGGIDLYKNLVNVTGRYVRLSLINYNIGYYRLMEFEVYTSDCDCEAPSLEINIRKPEENSIKLFPNPAGSEIWYSTEFYAVENIKIVDMQGNLLLSLNCNKSQGIIKIDNFKPGLYLFIIQSKGKNRVVKKFLKAQ